MTSFGAKTVNLGGFMPTFKIQGQVYHRIGSVLTNHFYKYILLVMMKKKRNFSLIFFSDVKPWLVGQLQKMLYNHNQHVRDFKRAIEYVPKGQEFKVVIQ